MSECRGCIRYKMADSGAWYEFQSEPGWSPVVSYIDTDALKRILAEHPREPIEVPWFHPAMQGFVDGHEMYPEHIEHVSDEPSMLGKYTYTRDSDGHREMFHICPDGHHRIAKRISQRQNVKFYLFTEAEMQTVTHGKVAELMRAKGVFVLGPTDDEIEQMFKESPISCQNTNS